MLTLAHPLHLYHRVESVVLPSWAQSQQLLGTSRNQLTALEYDPLRVETQTYCGTRIETASHLGPRKKTGPICRKVSAMLCLEPLAGRSEPFRFTTCASRAQQLKKLSRLDFEVSQHPICFWGFGKQFPGQQLEQYNIRIIYRQCPIGIVPVALYHGSARRIWQRDANIAIEVSTPVGRP